MKMFKFLQASRRTRTPSTTRLKFHGVSIKADSECACDAAGKLQGRRFLSDEAPYLPLDGCTDIESCECVYEHFDDRRTDARRQLDDGLPLRDHPNSYRHGRGAKVD